MQHKPFSRLFVAALGLCFLAMFCLAQEPRQEQVSSDLVPAENFGKTIPLWSYKVISSRGLPGNGFEGYMVGLDPSVKANQTKQTQIQTIILDFVLSFQDNNIIFDPTAVGPCLKDNNRNAVSATAVTLQSPLFLAFKYPKLNGVDLSKGLKKAPIMQYGDYFQRANFWQYVENTSYQVLLTGVIDVPTKVIKVPNLTGISRTPQVTGFCGPYGLIDINFFDGVVRTEINALKNNGLNPAQILPIILTDSVEFCDPLPDNCFVGYHSSYKNAAGDLQTYVVADFDTSGFLAGSAPTTFPLSHEIGEWMDDPVVSTPNKNGNSTPRWGSDTENVGQVPKDFCQDTLEVGDPLSMASPTYALKPFRVTQFNFSYTLQELAFFGWFYGDKSNFGSKPAGGVFSDNGTFTKDAGAIPKCKNGLTKSGA